MAFISIWTLNFVIIYMCLGCRYYEDIKFISVFQVCIYKLYMSHTKKTGQKGRDLCAIFHNCYAPGLKGPLAASSNQFIPWGKFSW